MARRACRGWAASAVGSLVLLVLAVLAAQAQDPTSGPVAVPNRSRLEAATEFIRKEYKDDYDGATTDKKKRTLAKMLLSDGPDQKSPDKVFAALNEARRIASDAGDAPTALAAMAELNDRFVFHDGPLTELVLSTVEPLVAAPGLTAENAARIVPLVLATASLTLERQDYERTARLGKIAAAAAAKADDAELKKQADALQSLSADLDKAAKTLATKPDDPDANDSLGIFLALVRGKWEAGLPHLAKSSDPKVRAAAARDVQNPSAGKDRAAVGDQWYDLGEAAKGSLRQRYRERAWEWYTAAAVTGDDPDGKAAARAAEIVKGSPAEFVREFKGHEEEVNGIAFSPDGQTLASASYDKTVRLWDMKTGKELRAIEHNGLVWDLAYSADGRTLATIEGQVVRTWDPGNGKAKLSLKHPELVWGVAFSPDSRMIATADGKTLKLWDASTGKEITTLKGHAGDLREMRFTPDGTMLASTGSDGVKLWDLRSFKEVRSLPPESSTSGLAISSDGKLLATSRSGLRLWSVQTGMQLKHMDLPASTWGVAFGPNGRLLASAHDDKSVRLWDTSTGREVRKFDGNTDRVNRVAFSPDGKWVASAGKDPVVRRWRVSTVLSRPTKGAGVID